MAKPSTCPVCKEPILEPTPNAPFCSGRCRDVDLGSWLSEGYRVSRPIMPWELDQALYQAPDDSDDN